MPKLGNSDDLVEAIRAGGWWQGAVVKASALLSAADGDDSYLVLISQTCNLFNPDFTKVPLVEFVVGRNIDDESNAYLRGDHPRILHVKAPTTDNEFIALEIFLHDRVWLERQALAQQVLPLFFIKNLANNQAQLPEMRVDWLDRLASWLARSYTRLALPDEFNQAMTASKIRAVLESKLIARHHQELYGVFLILSRGNDEPWDGPLGEMPGPYDLGITIVTDDDVDPDPLRDDLVLKLFVDLVGAGAGNRCTRAELARDNGIRILEESIEVKTMSQVSLKDLDSMIRYSFIDYLSAGLQDK